MEAKVDRTNLDLCIHTLWFGSFGHLRSDTHLWTRSTLVISFISDMNQLNSHGTRSAYARLYMNRDMIVDIFQLHNIPAHRRCAYCVSISLLCM